MLYMRRRQALVDLLAMSRFANLPTVWSNALLGGLLGLVFAKLDLLLDPLRFIPILLSPSLLYLGGCFFNDWHDFDFDRKTRPDRPLPSGRWQRRTVFALAGGFMALGLILSFFLSLASGYCGLGIVGCILIYTRWHKRSLVSLLFMAGARVLIYPLAALAFLPLISAQESIALFVFLALGMGGYILGISLSARRETASKSEKRENILPVLLLVSPAIIFSAPLLTLGYTFAVIPLIFFITLLALIVRQFRATGQVGRFVSYTLAMIPFVDWLIMAPLAPSLPILLLPPILACLALFLQRIAPAT
jgi:4-hydroxybenzoate polyprenyltransferase